MISKVTTVVLVVVGWVTPALSDEFYRDFRTTEFDASSFELVGGMADLFVLPGVDGLRIKLADGKTHDPTGVSLRFHVKGDFEITAGFDIETIEQPTTGYGVGVGLYVETDSPTKEGLTLERFSFPKAGEGYASTRASMINGERTYTSRRFPGKVVRSGQLRLSRRGDLISSWVAEGNATSFRRLQSAKISAGDLFYVRLAGDTGGSTCKLDAVFKDLRIKTGDLPPEIPDPVPPEPLIVVERAKVTEVAVTTASNIAFWVGLGVGVFAVLGVALFVRSHRKK